MSDFRLRPSQEAVISYTGGKMGVSAVPGSGKTFTLSHLAASLVERLAEAGLTDDQEVLIVTFTNPAVNSFRNRIARLVQQERGLLPYVGYRVRTLHGLAHDIVRMRPALVGLADNFEILDERVTSGIIRELADHWLRSNADRLLEYFDTSMVEDVEQVRYQIRQQGPQMIEDIAMAIIRLGKDNRWEPAEMRRRLDASLLDLPLARIGVEIYEDYQRSLTYRGAVDFDDLVRLAMEALQSDAEFLKRLRGRWPYILEDEAQDSSKLQNDMLRLLSNNGNWVRVGDPNQAIYTTFTTADSNFLRQFLAEPDVIDRPLRESGRSCRSIISLANRLVEWVATDPLMAHVYQTFYLQEIRPTDPGDPQANPDNGQIYLDWDPDVNMTPEKELDRVVKSIERWLPEHQDWTVAVLVPENSRGFKVAEELKERGIPYEELLRSTTATRDAAARLQTIFDYLAEPTNNRLLGRLYVMWWDTVWSKKVIYPNAEEALAARDTVRRSLDKVKLTEDFLWPSLESGALVEFDDSVDQFTVASVVEFRTQVRLWLLASELPVDQIILTISQVLFTDQADLALAHKIALVLKGIASNNPEYRLPELAQELRLIAQNQRRFLGMEDATTGYEPRRGVVTIATMHAAKGLEWDRVYLMAVNNYSFPAALAGDSFISEKWFLRDQLNIQAEARSQAELSMQDRAAEYVEGNASKEARLDYAAERLRLLYVGITRAKRDLVITWNMGRYWEQGRRNEPSPALIALTHFWKQGMQAT
jgi:DNA helicase-2/ATP-dependent DNA helicase PcrA